MCLPTLAPAALRLLRAPEPVLRRHVARRGACRVWQRGAVDRPVTLTFRRCPELFHRLHDYMW